MQPNANPMTPASPTTTSGGKPAKPTADPLSSQLAAEIDAAMAEMDKLAPAAPKPAPSAGRPAGIRGPRVVTAGREQRSGTVVSVGPTDIFVEFGPKELGVISRVQWPADKEVPKKDDPIDVVVDHRDPDGLLICTMPGSVQKADWEMLEPGQVIEARVTGVNKGGLDLEVANHRAFMPAGQVSLDHIKDLGIFVGEKMTCKVTRVDRAGRGNIVLSRRDILEEERKKQGEALKTTLAEGQVVEGTVRKIMPFGAFVDLGGIDGLVHISDMTYDRVGFGEKAVAKHVKEGEKIKVQILKLDWDANRVSLGLKQIAGDPFATAVNTIAEGSDVTGKVVRITEFGAFVEIAPGVDGLVHISEVDHKRIGKVEDVLKVDEIISARILKIDKDSRRVSLSIKALKPLPEVKIGEGDKAEGGGGRGPGGPGRGGRGGRGGRDLQGRSAEEILKETPALRRMREKAHQVKFKGGLG